VTVELLNYLFATCVRRLHTLRINGARAGVCFWELPVLAGLFMNFCVGAEKIGVGA